MNLRYFRKNLIPNLIVTIYFSIVFFAMVVSTIQAVQWAQGPFLGGFLDPSLHFIAVTKVLPNDSWPLEDRGLGSETKLLTIDGVQVKATDLINDHLNGKQPGDVVVISTITGDELREIEFRLSSFTFLDCLIYIYLPLFAGLISLIVGLWSFNDQTHYPLSTASAIFFTSLTLIFSTYFNFITSHDLSKLFLLGIGLAAGSLIQIAILLPRRWKSLKTKIGLSFIAYPHNLILVAIGTFQLRNISQGLPFMNTLAYLVISMAVSILILLVSFFTIRMNSISPLIRRYSESFLIASLLSFLPLFMQLSVNLVNHSVPPINPLFLLPMSFLPLIYFLTTRRFTIPQTQKRVFRTLIFILLTFLFGIIYLIIIFVINNVLMVQIRADNPLMIGIMIFLVVLVFEPIRDQISAIFNLRVDESIIDHELITLEFTTKLSASDTKENAIILLRDAIDVINHPDEIRIFTFSQNDGGFVEAERTKVNHQNNLIIPKESPLPATLIGMNTALFIRPGDKPVPYLDEKLNESDKEQVRLFVPIKGHLGLLGWVEIINHSKQKTYSEKDINLIEILTSQFALVYERSDTFDSMHKQLKEMEVLNRIANAINNLSDFDELLLTIFKTLKEVIPTDYFSLVFKSDHVDAFQRFFLIEKDQVLISTKKPEDLPPDFPEKQVIIKKKATLGHTENENWLYIPLELNHGIVGVLSLANSKINDIYSQLNLNLVQASANLVTGAIIKSRLLQASQNQADHLSKLNEVSQQLTSTLSMEPLLEKIVESAMEILHATSGALLIADDTDETLHFTVTNGPIGSQLLGKQLPKNRGVAGESYLKRSPVMKNNISKDDLYFWTEIPYLNEEITNILAVPLITQNEIIGILEIINKENNTPFNIDDMDALEGFASQAAIAIYNARIYSRTNQALESRVQELYTMQQIDGELHSSRKLDEALQTTLNAALTYTKVDSGSIMLVDTYYHEIDDIWQQFPKNDHAIHKDKFELIHFPWFSDEFINPYQLIDENVDSLSEQLGLKHGFKAHIIITSKLEDDLFSLLILHLDSPAGISDHDIEFLLGLTNHALIALRNAILYEDLQNAISAKNEFISFISHELKNPLTAIKGHADILAKGMVGEINEEQEDFLKTISHNVRRMSTFITDLSDQSQIESKSLRFVFAGADVSELVNEVLQTYNQQIKAKSIKIESRITEDLPQIWCDRHRLIQILANLVSNAVKYTPDGGNLIIAAEYAINEWDPKGAAEVVHFSVKDNGFGIDYEDQKLLFTKFFRGTNEKILKISGTGLGLRISKSLTEMMGGTMWFESVPGGGSTFHFTVPI